MRLGTVAVPFVLAGLVAGCAQHTFRADETGSAEDDALKLMLHRLTVRGGTVRIWATLENKSESPIRVSYGAFRLEVSGNTYGGALRVPFSRSTREITLKPLVMKKLSGPLEFLDVGKGGEATLTLRAVGRPPLSVTFPLP